jgi:hypothetical protein
LLPSCIVWFMSEPTSAKFIFELPQINLADVGSLMNQTIQDGSNTKRHLLMSKSLAISAVKLLRKIWKKLECDRKNHFMCQCKIHRMATATAAAVLQTIMIIMINRHDMIIKCSNVCW